MASRSATLSSGRAGRIRVPTSEQARTGCSSSKRPALAPAEKGGTRTPSSSSAAGVRRHGARGPIPRDPRGVHGWPRRSDGPGDASRRPLEPRKTGVTTVTSGRWEPPLEGVVGHDHVARTRVLGEACEHRAHRRSHGAQVDGNVGRVGDQPARGVEDRAGVVEALLDVGRHRGVAKHRTHLLRHGHEAVAEDFEPDLDRRARALQRRGRAVEGSLRRDRRSTSTPSSGRPAARKPGSSATVPVPSSTMRRAFELAAGLRLVTSRA